MTPHEHIEEAERLLSLAASHDEVGDVDAAQQVTARANVHARIAHASAALAMLTPRTATREQVDAEEAPGLAALQQLADNVGHLTEEIESLKETVDRAYRGPSVGPR